MCLFHSILLCQYCNMAEVDEDAGMSNSDKILFAKDLIYWYLIDRYPCCTTDETDIDHEFVNTRFIETLAKAIDIIDNGLDASVCEDFELMKNANTLNCESFTEYAKDYQKRYFSSGFHGIYFLKYCSRLANLTGYFWVSGKKDIIPTAVNMIVEVIPDDDTSVNGFWVSVGEAAEMLAEVEKSKKFTYGSTEESDESVAELSSSSIERVYSEVQLNILNTHPRAFNVKSDDLQQPNNSDSESSVSSTESKSSNSNVSDNNGVSDYLCRRCKSSATELSDSSKDSENCSESDESVRDSSVETSNSSLQLDFSGLQLNEIQPRSGGFGGESSNSLSETDHSCGKINSSESILSDSDISHSETSDSSVEIIQYIPNGGRPSAEIIDLETSDSSVNSSSSSETNHRTIERFRTSSETNHSSRKMNFSESLNFDDSDISHSETSDSSVEIIQCIPKGGRSCAEKNDLEISDSSVNSSSSSETNNRTIEQFRTSSETNHSSGKMYSSESLIFDDSDISHSETSDSSVEICQCIPKGGRSYAETIDLEISDSSVNSSSSSHSSLSFL